MITRLRSVRRISKSKVGRRNRVCHYCGFSHKDRLQFWVEDDDVVAKKYYEVCFSAQSDRVLVAEINAEFHAKGLYHRMKPYEQLYPACWKRLFGQTDYVFHAGKVLKQDVGILCVKCGTGETLGGAWVSSKPNRKEVTAKKAICFHCLKGLL